MTNAHRYVAVALLLSAKRVASLAITSTSMRRVLGGTAASSGCAVKVSEYFRPACARVGTQSNPAAAGFPGVVLNVAPGGTPVAAIVIVTLGASCARAERLKRSGSPGAARSVAPSAGVGGVQLAGAGLPTRAAASVPAKKSKLTQIPQNNGVMWRETCMPAPQLFCGKG